MVDRQRFEALLGRSFGSDMASAWSELDAGYADQRRTYHNWAHIEAMLAGLDAARDEAEFADVRFDEVELAIWFHDAVYDPLAKDNEASSAALFEQAAAGGQLDIDKIARVREMILATALHVPSDDPSTQLLLDLDLAVLGGDSQAYARYVRAVRQEYAAVPDDAWRAGRPAVLKRFLERPTIYQTTYFRDRLEVRARENILGEITALEA